MDFIMKPKSEDEQAFCPIWNKKISAGLCFDISNIGNDSLNLPQKLRPPCGWRTAHEICDTCENYN
ncbi:hypothetical protein [Caproicibacterium argilliputei]|uniref:Uncharacterized protein n=1 Tax=Caproicibacterium argilliputei TaxID=3030016 RepID=A0AA97DAH7_9FIRM|nr:hypothetical protein [Caproicibacterium argilliputei]WOC33244.1 hypothetical protein PXC00_05060 [Caproicibacterium argilliputei]